MSIVVASIVAAVTGIALRNIMGYLQAEDDKPFDIRKSLASGIIAVMVGIPVIVAAFEGAFGESESIPETAQLVIFTIQVSAIAGFDALTKGGFKAAKRR